LKSPRGIDMPPRNLEEKKMIILELKRDEDGSRLISIRRHSLDDVQERAVVYNTKGEEEHYVRTSHGVRRAICSYCTRPDTLCRECELVRTQAERLSKFRGFDLFTPDKDWVVRCDAQMIL